MRAAPLIIIAALSSCGSAGPRADTGPLPETILAIEQARLAAFRADDKAAFSRLVADELTMVHSDGSVFGKNEEMGVMRPSTPGRPLPTLAVEDTLVRGYGESAVLTGSLVERSGDKVLLRLRFTNVYARKQGRWMLVAGQLTRATPTRSARAT